MPVQPINSLDEFKSLVNSGQVVVIDFWATWCGPCRVISPIFEKFSNQGEYAGIKFHKVDVDEQEAVSQEVGIRAMPTFIIYKGGQKINELVGANPQGLQELVNSAQSLAA